MNLKNIKVLKSIAALSLAAMMSLSGVCAFADTTEPGEETTAKAVTPFFYKQPAPGFSMYYYDDFESWTVDKNVVEGEIEQSLGTGDAKNDGSTRNLWNTWSPLDRQKITEIDGDKCLTLLPAGDGNNAASINCTPGEDAYSTYNRRWNTIECRFRLVNSKNPGTTDPAATIALEHGDVGKLIKIDKNSITIFPDTKTDADTDRVYKPGSDESTLDKWYTLKIEFAFPKFGDSNWREQYYNNYKITVSEDSGNNLLTKNGNDFKSVAYGEKWLGNTRPIQFKCSGASGTEFNLSKIKIQSIQTYENDWETKIIDPVREISKPSVTEEGEKVTTSYDFTNLTFGDKTGVDPLNGAVLSVNSDNGKNDCMSESFAPHKPGDAADSSKHEFINKKIEFDNNDNPTKITAANVGAVRGRLSAKVEGTAANVNTYLLDSLDGLKLHGVKDQKSASITEAKENDNGTVTITGTAENYEEGDKVLLYIIKNGTTLSEIDADNSKNSDLVYVKEVTPDSSTGEFIAELTPELAGGVYNVGIGGSHKTNTETPLNVSGISLNVKCGDKDINKLNDIEDGNADVSVNAAFVDKDELDKSMMCVATYKGGVLTGIKMGVVDSTAKTLTATFKKGDADRAAIFIWNKTTYAPYKFKDIK